MTDRVELEREAHAVLQHARAHGVLLVPWSVHASTAVPSQVRRHAAAGFAAIIRPEQRNSISREVREGLAA